MPLRKNVPSLVHKLQLFEDRGYARLLLVGERAQWSRDRVVVDDAHDLQRMEAWLDIIQRDGPASIRLDSDTTDCEQSAAARLALGQSSEAGAKAFR